MRARTIAGNRRLALFLAAFLLACSRDERGAAHAPPAHPAPTEHWLSPDRETVLKEQRKAWFEERHKAPPDVDWRDVERRNGLAQVGKRNSLADIQPWQPDPVHWVERGSDNQAGRMHVAKHSLDGTRLYAGSSKGGLWKGALDGSTWKPIGDNLYGGAHHLAVVPSPVPGAPNVVLAATDGGLIHVTRNEGKTWEQPAGLSFTYWGVRRVLVKSDGSETIFLLARDSTGQHRLYRSTDAAQSFVQVNGLGTYGGDVWTPRDGGGEVFLLRQDQIWRSDDNGDSWSLVGSLGTGSTSGDLVGSEAGAPRLWAIVQVGGARQLHRSNDAGATWTFVRNASDYWIGSLNASIVDADLFAYGGVEVSRTTNAGASFSIVNPWGAYYANPQSKLHADIPGIDVVPDGGGGEIWYVSTDGGLYRSFDGLASVGNLSLTGLRVSQYYSTLTSATEPNRVHAGSQDQGYQRATQPPSQGTALGFNQLISGDYGHLTSGDGTDFIVVSTYPGFILVYVGTMPSSLLSLDFPVGETHAWMPPVVADPGGGGDFFFCASKIYRYDRNEPFYTWSTALWSPYLFGVSPGEYVSALTFSPVDPDRAYAATNHGRLFHSSDHGLTWTESLSVGPGGQYFYGTALLASSLDADTVWVGGSGYGVPSVYRSTDGGVTFSPWDDGLPDTLVYCLGEAPDGSGDLFAGTETAVYRRDDGAPEWVDVTGAEAPVTTYWSVEALAHENTMRFGTYGRGIWDYRLEPSGAWEAYGCGVNPEGSLRVLSGRPAPGERLRIALDNPLGTQAAGARSVLVLSLAPSAAYPCGRVLSGRGMAGDGELLIGLGPGEQIRPSLRGGAWGGPGEPALVELRIPSSADLIGRSIFAQGLLIDGTEGGRAALTEAIELRIGP